MSERLQSVLVVVSALGCGLVAGVFFAFSSFVMGALARLSAPSGISAMQTINITVINPLFMGVLFGTAILSLVLGYWSLQALHDPRALKILAGAILYVAGSIFVTLVFNVPLNDALAAADPASRDGALLWIRYIDSWTAWNHVRGLAALAASAAFISALF
ncbi:MAG: anthrone oxygenase family protein [Aestuariivirga sp.]